VKPPFAGEAAAGATALEVELPEGKWLAEWVDTKSGETTGSVKISGGGVRAVEAPSYETDIALRLRRTGR
jgi:hypothetical protein